MLLQPRMSPWSWPRGLVHNGGGGRLVAADHGLFFCLWGYVQRAKFLIWDTVHGATRDGSTKETWYGARVGRPKYYAVNLILRLFLYHFLHTMSSWHHESIHNNTNNQQTPPPWWWSRSPLQRHGFDESTLSEWRAALLMFVPRLLSKGFGRINKLK